MQIFKACFSSLFIASIIVTSMGTSATESKDAWNKLAGAKQSERPEFSYLTNNPYLSNVLIYGDSISIGYTQRVREQLQNQANVYRLYRNGGESASFIKKMTTMHKLMQSETLSQPWDFQWDVIHFNVGLHDLKYVLNGKLDKKNGKQVSSLTRYKQNLHAIVAYLKELAPNAKLIFATTTPVPENADGRNAGDAQKYNQAALSVIKQYPSIIINDLYRLTKPVQTAWWIKPGDVHYNKTGKEAQGDQVASFIKHALTTNSD
ncbi:SGNH/GDSL hydrolase family protein [Shewanella sp. 10N.7]|uniref:SGNH/GDSL hydrolase family protein n=1 Tax=Shewanella sp. 10N.7 TaxID=2885093 RepID=UPI001E2B39CE|nr:SGNH/GDSL hydrolase family protein [Shewanella sp. 10N.7]MCC4831814.1 SGNH/GDSL hydrolase family protein [Shewanella sp. 10N.7]